MYVYIKPSLCKEITKFIPQLNSIYSFGALWGNVDTSAALELCVFPLTKQQTTSQASSNKYILLLL
jgi:hypothetical protein